MKLSQEDIRQVVKTDLETHLYQTDETELVIALNKIIEAFYLDDMFEE